MESTIESVAVRACLEAGRVLDERFSDGTLSADRSAHDVKSEADRAAEDRILDIVQSAVPDHAIYAEEAGTLRTDGDYRWVIDPLDGTNNFVSGIPSFGSAIAVLDDSCPVLGVVYVPVTDDLYVARRGDGILYNGEPVTADSSVPTTHATVGYVIGRGVKHDEREDAAGALFDALDAETKRVLPSWSPVVHWGLLARGRLEAMVAFHADEEERYVGELFAREAGASISVDGPLFVAAATAETSEALTAAGRDAIRLSRPHHEGGTYRGDTRCNRRAVCVTGASDRAPRDAIGEPGVPPEAPAGAAEGAIVGRRRYHERTASGHSCQLSPTSPYSGV